jgi:hypothetical protein
MECHRIPMVDMGVRLLIDPDPFSAIDSHD